MKARVSEPSQYRPSLLGSYIRKNWQRLARFLQDALQIIGKDREGPDLLLDVGASVSLVLELDVFEVFALSLAEREELVAEYARLRNRAARVIHAVHHQELGPELIRELDRTPVAPEVAVLLGIAHL